MQKKNLTFEEFRNSTNFYEFINRWNKEQKNIYNEDPRLEKIFSNFYEYQTLRYIGGADLPCVPRGLLLYHEMGTGKTIEALSSSLYAVSTLPQYEKTQGLQEIVFILNRSLLIKTQKDLEKYVKMLNYEKLGLDLEPREASLDYEEVLSNFEFIIMNDPTHFTDKFDALFGINDQIPRIIIFDEAHNLFRNINNTNKKGMGIYNELMTNQHIEILFLTGSAIGNEPCELAFCFEMLSGNPKLFNVNIKQKTETFFEVSTDFDDFFISTYESNPAVRYKDIFIKRIAGLTSYVEVDLTGSKQHLLPALRDTEFINIQLTDPYQIHLYKEEKKNEKGIKGKDDSFMQRSKMASNMADKGDVIVSSKFKHIKSFIEENHGKVHIIFSNFIESGILAFGKYCQQNTEKSLFNWRPFNPEEPVKSAQDEIVYAEIHGDVDQQTREEVIEFLNDPKNKHGETIDVLLLSEAGTEGINTHHVRFVHIMEPEWSETTIEEVIFRAVRLGSHMNLPEEERNVTPFIYVSYLDKEIDMQDKATVRDNMESLSTDELILYKAMKKAEIVSEFSILLELGSISCRDYKDIIIKSIRHRLSKKEQENPCFKCESNGKRLFDPNDIHQDITNHDCLVDYKDTTDKKIMINHVAYSWFVDIYSTTGVRVYCIRDNKYVPEDSDLFDEIIKQIPTYKHTAPEEVEEEYKDEQYDTKMPVVMVDAKSKTAQDPDVLNFSKKTIYSKLLASNLKVEIIPLNESLGTAPFYKALELMKFKANVEDTIEFAKKELQNTERLKKYPIPTDDGSKYMFNTKIIHSSRLFEDVMVPLYSNSVDFEYADLVDKLIPKIKEKGSIVIVRGNDTSDLDIELLIQHIRLKINNA